MMLLLEITLCGVSFGLAVLWYGAVTRGDHETGQADCFVVTVRRFLCPDSAINSRLALRSSAMAMLCAQKVSCICSCSIAAPNIGTAI